MSLVVPTAATTIDPLKNFTFGLTDYILFIIMLATSAGIGIYFGFFSKAKNTTDEYLMGGKRMKTIPIAISLVASQLSAISMMSVPSENYSYGLSYIFVELSMFACMPVLSHIIIPVFYDNNLSNCYEYLQLRFNKRTRQLVTASFILNAFLVLPVVIFVPSLAFSQVTGISIHTINIVVCSICVFYTMLGGIKAVVWTDVVQAGIMISSVVLIGILGTIKSGGITQVYEKSYAGGRLDFNYSWDPRVRITVWNSLIGGFIMWTGHVGLNQSCVQRIVSLPSLRQAKIALYLAGIGFVIIMTLNCFIGIVMYARYHGCDPMLTGLVEKADKIMPFFVQDVMGHLSGMPGVFISCVFSAALSSMSAILNSLAGVVYFDYIKPFVKHTEAKANAIMKVFIVAMGVYCVLAGYMVEKFDSIMQLVVTISGISTGAVVGVFLVGMFIPRVNAKNAMASICVSVLTMLWIITDSQMKFRAGIMKYSPLPTTTDQCELNIIQIKETFILKNTTMNPLFSLGSTTEIPLITTAYGSNRQFSFTEISFYWYKFVGAALIWLAAIPLSYIFKSDEGEKQNPKLFSPAVRKFLKNSAIEMEEMPLKTTQDDEKLPQTSIYMPDKSLELKPQSRT